MRIWSGPYKKCWGICYYLNGYNLFYTGQIGSLDINLLFIPLSFLKLSWVYTSCFHMHFYHTSLLFFNKLLWFFSSKVIYLKLQPNVQNACGNRMCKPAFNNRFENDILERIKDKPCFGTSCLYWNTPDLPFWKVLLWLSWVSLKLYLSHFIPCPLPDSNPKLLS